MIKKRIYNMLLPPFIIFLTVSISLSAAWILSYAAGMGRAFGLVTVVLIGTVLTLNIVRFLLWGWIHHRVPLSRSYPLTAMFFPLIALISTIQGEVIAPRQWVGVAIMTTGVIWYSFLQDKKT